MSSDGKTSDKVQWDQNFEPLIKLLLDKKKGIKTKSAAEIGKKKIDYFRGKDFKKFMLESGPLVKKRCQLALDAVLDGELPRDDRDVERLGDELISRNFCYKAMYQPLNPTKKDPNAEKTPVKKWPDRVSKTPNQKFDCDGFYAITYEGDPAMQHLFLALIIAGVLLACLFPVWPMWAKVGLWYLAVIFLSFYFGLLLVRMVIYTLFWIVGFDFWIYPNINDEYCSFMDSFRPFYSWDKRGDDAIMLLVRFGSLAIMAVAVQQIAETTSMHDVQDFVVSSYADVLDWGIEKLTQLEAPAEKAALPNLRDLEKDGETPQGEDILKATDPKVSGEDDDDDDAEEAEVKDKKEL